MMMHHNHQSSPVPPLDFSSLQRSTSATHATLRPSTPRSALAATYSTYVVRVHTRHGIKTISFDVLAAFFTYTAKKAAEDLGISSRTLIRVCRSLGIRRWPYLGFRSEKNVERIRQEAIENLRRKLERESSEASSSSSSSTFSSSSSSGHHANVSCLRGASAKRLLQVKLPSQAAVSMARGFERPSVFGPRGFPHSHHMHTQPRTQCVHTIVSPTAYANSHRIIHQQSQQLAHPLNHGMGLPLLTPPPTHHAFDLERPSLSPRRLQPTHTAVTSLRKHHLPVHAGPGHHEVSRPTGMPSLNVLMEASILTTFKHEVETHLAQSSPPPETETQHHARTMSMRDILSNTAMTA